MMGAMEKIICIPKITNRKQLADLKNDAAIGVNVNVVYVYFLLNSLILYPKNQSNILYIGEAMREKEATGVRFRQHITPSSTEGADTGNNLVLSQYFHAGMKIGLAIFKTDEARTERERDLIYSHIHIFGAPPIAQGKIPHDKNGKNRTSHIFSFIAENEIRIANASKILNSIVAEYGKEL
jgi:hypothetical protein